MTVLSKSRWSQMEIRKLQISRQWLRLLRSGSAAAEMVEAARTAPSGDKQIIGGLFGRHIVLPLDASQYMVALAVS